MKSDSVHPPIITPAPVFVIAVTLVNLAFLWMFGLTAVMAWITAHAGSIAGVIWFVSFWLCFLGAQISLAIIVLKMAAHLLHLLLDGLFRGRARVISN